VADCVSPQPRVRFHGGLQLCLYWFVLQAARRTEVRLPHVPIEVGEPASAAVQRDGPRPLSSL